MMVLDFGWCQGHFLLLSLNGLLPRKEKMMS